MRSLKPLLSILIMLLALVSAPSHAEPDNLITVNIKIYWFDDVTPVAGAHIYDHIPNKLLGETDSKGTLSVKVKEGTILRYASPDYGLQQKLVEVRLPNELRAAGITVMNDGAWWTKVR